MHRYILLCYFLLSCTCFAAQDKVYQLNEDDYLTSKDIEWDLNKRIYNGQLKVLDGLRFSYSGEKNNATDKIVQDSNYVILDYKFPAEIGMYEIRQSNTEKFSSLQGFSMGCFDIKNKLVEVIGVPCGKGSRMMAIPLTQAMIEKKKIAYIKFSIPKEGDYSRPVITNWGQYVISNPRKRELYKNIFENGIVSTKFFKKAKGENTDRNRIQAAINLAYWGKKVEIESSYINVDKPIEVFYLQDIQMLSNTVIAPSDNFDGKDYSNSVVEYDAGAARIQLYKGADRYTMWVPYPEESKGLMAVERRGIRGGCIDGRGIANCVWISHARGLILDEVSLKNPRQYGVRITGSQEMFISRCTCINTVESNNVNVAFSIASPDNMIRDCIAIDTNVGFVLPQYTIANSLHHWIGMISGKYENSVSFRISPNTSLIGCYADTSEVCYEIRDEEGTCNLIGCFALSNPRMTEIKEVTGIKAVGKGKVNVTGCTFNLNTSAGFEKNIRMVDGHCNVSFH